MDLIDIAIAKKFNNNNNSSSSGNINSNNNLILKLSEGRKTNDGWSIDFSPVTFKDVFDTISNGYNVIVINDKNEESWRRRYSFMTLDVQEAYYEVSIEDEETNEYSSTINISLGWLYASNYELFKEGDTIDSWLNQPLILNIAD